MFSLSYTNMSFKLKYILYKANKLMMIYSYVITSLPEEAQGPSSIALAYPIGWSGHVAPAAHCSRHPGRVLGTLVLVELKRMAPSMPGWSRPQVSPVGSQLMAILADLLMAYPVQVLSHLHTGQCRQLSLKTGPAGSSKAPRPCLDLPPLGTQPLGA